MKKHINLLDTFTKVNNIRFEDHENAILELSKKRGLSGDLKKKLRQLAKAKSKIRELKEIERTLIFSIREDALVERDLALSEVKRKVDNVAISIQQIIKGLRISGLEAKINDGDDLVEVTMDFNRSSSDFEKVREEVRNKVKTAIELSFPDFDSHLNKWNNIRWLTTTDGYGIGKWRIKEEDVMKYVILNII